jgi:hypothetical protein
MQQTIERPFCLDDFRPFLKFLVESEDQSTLVGGLAVSGWAEIFLEGAERHQFDLPIFSKDIDLRGLKMTCTALTKSMQLEGAIVGGVVAAVRKSAPEMGRVFAASLTWRSFKTSVEVLERLPGLDTGIDDPPAGTTLTPIENLVLLDPCSLFICKLHAANSRPAGQAGNDVKHLAILARVIPRFLAKLRAVVVPEYDGKEDAERLLKKIEACESGQDVFKIPLVTAEKARLIEALREHLAWDSGQS